MEPPSLPYLRAQIVWRGKSDAVVLLNRAKIRSVGVPAVAGLLCQLQVFKATADVARGRDLYQAVTEVPSEQLLALRRAVIAQSPPRPGGLYCQVSAPSNMSGLSEIF